LFHNCTIVRFLKLRNYLSLKYVELSLVIVCSLNVCKLQYQHNYYSCICLHMCSWKGYFVCCRSFYSNRNGNNKRKIFNQLSPACGVYMSQLIRYSRTFNSYQDFVHRSVLLTRKLLNQCFIETRMRSILKKCFGRYHHLTLPYRVSVTTMANDICRPWYCCHEYLSFLDTT